MSSPRPIPPGIFRRRPSPLAARGESALGLRTAKAAFPFHCTAALALCQPALKVGQEPSEFYQKIKKPKRKPKLAPLPAGLHSMENARPWQVARYPGFQFSI